MAYRDLVKQAATVNGTGAFALGAAASGYQSMLGGGRNVGDIVEYRFSLGTEWEAGYGTIAAGNTLNRAPTASTNGGALVNFPAGTGEIIETMIAASANSFRRERPGEVAFSSALPLDFKGDTFLAPYTMSGPLTLTVAAGAVRNAGIYARITSNYAGAPVMPGSKLDYSGDYDTTPGVVNYLNGWYDGYEFLYAWSKKASAAATAPGAPTIGTATAGDGYMDVAFSAPASNGGSVILDYTATTSGGQTATGTTSPIRVTVPNGTAQTATVKARNAVGQSAASAASNSVTPAAAAQAPTGPQTVALSPIANITNNGGGTYTGNGGAFQDPQTGVFAKPRQIGVDGSASFVATNISGSVNPLMGVYSSASIVDYNSMDFFWYGNGNYSSGGRGNTPGPVTACQPGDIQRTRWVGSTFYAEIARAASPTVFITLFTWTNVPNTMLYIMVSCQGSLVMNNFKGEGLAP